MKNLLKIGLVMLIAGTVAISTVEACSRITYTTKTGEVVTGRNMDWFEPDDAQIRVFKRGEIKKVLQNKPCPMDIKIWRYWSIYTHS